MAIYSSLAKGQGVTRVISSYCSQRLLRIERNGALSCCKTLSSVTQWQNDHRARFSTTNGLPGRKAASNETRIQRFRMLMNTFMFGSKQLGKDVKRMVKIKKKLRDCGYDWNTLTTEEILLLHQTRKDLMKSLPAVALFFIPFIGYAAPVVAFMYPKQLLSRHYWQPHQREKFARSDALKRKHLYLSLIREVGRSALPYKAHRKRRDLLQVTAKAIDEDHPTNTELLETQELFTGELLRFEKLPRYHLKKLSQVWLVSPWLPNRLLRVRLRRHLASIRIEDAALQREGLDSLHEEQLKEVCHSRGLDTTDIDTEALVKWLSEWVELSNAVADKDDSLLAHSAIYKSMNYGKKGQELR